MVIKESADIWLAVFEHAPFAIYTLSVDGQLTAANPSSAVMFGVADSADLLGRSFETLYVEGERALARNKLEQVMSGQSAAFEARSVAGGLALSTLVPLVVDGAIGGVLGFAQPEQQEAIVGRELRASEARQRLMLAHSPDFLFTANAELRYTFFLNPPAGLNVPSLVGLSDEEVFSSDDAAELVKLKRAVLESGAGAEHDVTLTVRGQKHQYALHLLPTRGVDGTVDGILGYARDLTLQRKAEWERERIHRQLLRTQKLESLGVLASLLAHDFNNILVSILGNAALVELDLPTDHPAKLSIAKLVGEAERATALTREMLSYSGEEDLNIRPMNISAAIMDIQHLLQSTVSRRAQLELELPLNLPSIEADPAQIQQLMMNLVANAAEAIAARPSTTPGLIKVRTSVPEMIEEQQDDAALVTGDLVAPGAFITLEVSDNGIGMDDKTRNRIFDPFFSTKGAGRGLGLAAVRSIVRTHNAAIHVSSHPGKGTSFRVLFSTALPRDEEPPRPDDELRGEGIVLVADEDPTLRGTAGRALMRYGYRVLFAENGKTTLEIYRRHAKVIRAAVVDGALPDLPGADLVAELRKLRADLPLVVTRGVAGWHPGAAERINHLRYLQKPYSAAHLAEKIRQALDS
jgi:PAS domain S-box-containing protein